MTVCQTSEYFQRSYKYQLGRLGAVAVTREGCCPQRPIIFPRDARMKNNRALSLPVRRVRLNRPSGTIAEKIRDVEDNVPPRNGCWG